MAERLQEVLSGHLTVMGTPRLMREEMEEEYQCMWIVSGRETVCDGVFSNNEVSQCVVLVVITRMMMTGIEASHGRTCW